MTSIPHPHLYWTGIALRIGPHMLRINPLCLASVYQINIYLLGDLEKQKTKIYYPTKMFSLAYHLSTAESDAISILNMALWVIFAVLSLLPLLSPPISHCFAFSMPPMTWEFKPSSLSSYHSLYLIHVVVFLITTWNSALCGELSFNSSILNVYASSSRASKYMQPNC